jgi:hypothetical protein
LKAEPTELSLDITRSANIGNIGPSGQRQRRVVGAVGTVAAFALIAWLDRSATSRWWRLGAFPLFWMGLVGLLQARAKTCVAYAARRTCDQDAPGVVNATLAPGVADLLNRRASQILRRATIIAAGLTLLALLAP